MARVEHLSSLDHLDINSVPTIFGYQINFSHRTRDCLHVKYPLFEERASKSGVRGKDSSLRGTPYKATLDKECHPLDNEGSRFALRLPQHENSHILVQHTHSTNIDSAI